MDTNDETLNCLKLTAGTSIRILQVTDCHLYADPDGALAGMNTQESFDRVLNLIRENALPADLVLATGDLVHDASVAGYDRLRERLESLGLPVFCLAGNHDDPETLSGCLNGSLVQAPKRVRIGDWLLVLLDSTFPGAEGGRLAPAELGELENSLADHPGCHKLITLHHHPTPVGSAWMDRIALDNPEPFFSILDRYQEVRGILWGHIHQPFDSTRNGVRLMGSPSTCIQFVGNRDDFAIDHSAPGFRWLELAPDGAITTGITLLEAIPSGLDMSTRGY